MANITAALVNELRKRTGVGMMDCKKALVECDGDMDKAIDYLREKGQKLAAKRADRDASEGAVLAAVNQDKTFAAVIMMNCETDFVAKNEDFVAFSRSILEAAVASKVKTLEEVMALTIEGKSVETMIIEQVAKIGEKSHLPTICLLKLLQPMLTFTRVTEWHLLSECPKPAMTTKERKWQCR